MPSLRNLTNTVHALGIGNSVSYWREKVNESVSRNASPKSDKFFSLMAPGLKYPVVGRVGTSDLSVFRQIFVEQEYSCLPETRQAQTIVDCGANVGYSSVYFLNRFPEARVIAIEPDSDNFSVLKRNLAPFGERAVAVNAGVWSHKADLVVKREVGDGQPWSFTVMECATGEDADVHAVDIGTIMQDYGLSAIDILKVDIEGSEKVVFKNNYSSWLDRTKLLVMELHGSECEDVVKKATSSRPYTETTFGELVVFDFAVGHA